jgi:hypothetical protein
MSPEVNFQANRVTFESVLPLEEHSFRLQLYSKSHRLSNNSTANIRLSKSECLCLTAGVHERCKSRR